MRPFFFNIDTIVWKVNITDRKNFFSLLLSQKNMQVLFRFFSEAREKKTCNKSHTHTHTHIQFFLFSTSQHNQLKYFYLLDVFFI